MKKLEDIEKLSVEELEIASSTVEVPDGLRGRIEEALAAETLAAHELAPEAPSARRWLPYTISAAAAIAVVAAVGLGLQNREPRDSFDDPYLAYAEVEKAFQTISDKMSESIDIINVNQK